MMRLLLDSHAFAWLVFADRRLSDHAKAAIDAAEIVRLSAVSALELSIKVRIGKWPQAAALAADLPDVLRDLGVDPLPITLEHARLAGALQGHHRDPFDRVLAAQSRIEQLALVTIDPAFATFGTKTIW